MSSRNSPKMPFRRTPKRLGTNQQSPRLQPPTARWARRADRGSRSSEELPCTPIGTSVKPKVACKPSPDLEPHPRQSILRPFPFTASSRRRSVSASGGEVQRSLGRATAALPKTPEVTAFSHFVLFIFDAFLSFLIFLSLYSPVHR